MKKFLIILLALSLLGFFGLQIDWGGSRPPGCAFCNAEILERQVFYRVKGAPF